MKQRRQEKTKKESTEPNEIMTNKSIKKSRLISRKFTYQRVKRMERVNELNGGQEISLILGRNYSDVEREKIISVVFVEICKDSKN